MVLGKFQGRGVLLIWIIVDEQYIAVQKDGIVLIFFSYLSIIFFFFLPLSERRLDID